MSDKIYEIPAEWTKRAFITEAEYKKMYASSLADPNGFWAEQAKRIHWMKHFSKVKNTSFAKAERLDQMVRGRRHQRRLQLHRPPPAHPRRPDRHHLGRRRSERFKAHHLQGIARRGLPLRQYSAQPQRQERRPRHHLHADDSGSGLRHARLRAHRRDPFRGVRRLLAGFARRPHRGLQVERRHHRRRRHCAAAARCR